MGGCVKKHARDRDRGRAVRFAQNLMLQDSHASAQLQLQMLGTGFAESMLATVVTLVPVRPGALGQIHLIRVHVVRILAGIAGGRARMLRSASKGYH